MSGDLTPELIQKMARNFMPARILLTAVELDLFPLLAPAPMTVDEIVSTLGIDVRATTILLDVLAALGYLEKVDGLYRTEPSLVTALSDGTPDSILPGLRHAANLWQTWTQLTEVVQHAGPARRPGTGSRERTKAFIGAMHVIASRQAPEVVKVISPGQARSLLDVGGGSGSYTIAFLREVPGMQATLLDLPEVIELARERVSEAGLLDRVRLMEGDYHDTELPPGHDLALLSAIIHQNGHRENLDLYRRVFRALVPGGRLVIRDYVLSSDRTEPAGGAVFAVNMLVNTDGGNSYTLEEIGDGLTEAGFTRVRQLQDREMFSLVEAFKP